MTETITDCPGAAKRRPSPPSADECELNTVAAWATSDALVREGFSPGAVLCWS